MFTRSSTAFVCRLGAALAAAVLAACVSHGVGPGEALQAPYPPSRLIRRIDWDFTVAAPPRRALGSDLWPCTWARDDALYCAWGDGGGFDGNDDRIGRVSLGFARLEGGPKGRDGLDFTGKNVWGLPGWAEHVATFGGKVSSVVAVDGVLYGIGAFWTAESSKNPVAQGAQGPLRTLIWSSDAAASWQIAPWSTRTSLGSFLNVGRDDANASGGNAPGGYVYLYYTRADDTQHVYLKRTAKERLKCDPSTPGAYEYLADVTDGTPPQAWSPRESDARAVFADPNHVDGPDVVYDAPLHRYWLTVAHTRPGDAGDASIGGLGVFVSRHPWGPWTTVGYYSHWGDFGSKAGGDYLGLRFPAKWMSSGGKTLWGVYSGPGPLDAFNLVEARLTLRARWLDWLGD
jgi:hypothetical protein